MLHCVAVLEKRQQDIDELKKATKLVTKLKRNKILVRMRAELSRKLRDNLKKPAGCWLFLWQIQKNALLLHFFFHTPMFWELKAVILHRKSKITVMNDYDRIMESIDNTKGLILGLIWDIIKLIFFGALAIELICN